MEARLKKDCKYPTLRLFFGREYNKTDWVAIPDGFEAQAKESAFLDVRLTEDLDAPVNAVRGSASSFSAAVSMR